MEALGLGASPAGDPKARSGLRLSTGRHSRAVSQPLPAKVSQVKRQHRWGYSLGSPSGGRCGPNCAARLTPLGGGQSRLWPEARRHSGRFFGNSLHCLPGCGLRCAGVGRRQPARAPGVALSRGLGRWGEHRGPHTSPREGPSAG